MVAEEMGETRREEKRDQRLPILRTCAQVWRRALYCLADGVSDKLDILSEMVARRVSLLGCRAVNQSNNFLGHYLWITSNENEN